MEKERRNYATQLRDATQQRAMYVCDIFSEYGLHACSSGIFGLTTEIGMIISAKKKEKTDLGVLKTSLPR